jgi:hypothetical protein
MTGTRFWLRATLLATAAVIARSNDAPAGSITGQGRFEKIAGNPAAGYKYLYEWDLFLSPPDASLIGPSRRMGAPPGQPPTGDGYYQIGGLPAGNYSVYVNQPDFFASPKVVPNVRIGSGQTHLDVDLDVDYSTYFRDSGEWTSWEWDLYQTFVATGTSIRGVSWIMAGSGLYGGKEAVVTILEANRNPNPIYWTPVHSAVDRHLSADSDEWVRWESGIVPTTPGKQYAVKIHIDGGMAVYKRNKDSLSYRSGEAYNKNGERLGYDLNLTVFTDRDQMVTHTSKTPGPGAFHGELGDTRWGQTFVASGRALAAVDLFAASGQADIDLTWRVLAGGPRGRQVGPTKRTLGSYFASSTDLIGVSFSPDEVRLTPGQVYYIEATGSTAGFTPYMMGGDEAYADGQAWRNGTATSYDLSMTIVEYSSVPEPAVLPLVALAVAVGLVRSVRRKGRSRLV